MATLDSQLSNSVVYQIFVILPCPVSVESSQFYFDFTTHYGIEIEYEAAALKQ